MAFDFLKEINESVLTDNDSSIYKAIAQILELEEEDGKELYGLIPMGSELGLVEILDANETTKEDVIEYLKKIEGLDLKKFVNNKQKSEESKESKKKEKDAETLGLDKEIKESKRDSSTKSINITYSKGDVVLLETGEEITILKQGPHQTYKVLINGETTMVDSKKVKEGVLGMTAVPGLKRLQELAGMPNEDPMSNIEAAPIDMDAGNEDWELGANDAGMDNMDNDMDYADDAGMDMTGDMDDTGMDMAGIDEPVVDAPVDLMAPIMPGTDAFGEIQTHINSISDMLLDIKISEFKPLLGQMEDLLTDLRNRGNDALREHLELRAKLKVGSKIVKETKNRVNIKKK